MNIRKQEMPLAGRMCQDTLSMQRRRGKGLRVNTPNQRPRSVIQTWTSFIKVQASCAPYFISTENDNGIVYNTVVGIFISMTNTTFEKLKVKHNSCIEIYSYSCLHPLSNERKTMFKSGDSRAV